MKRFSFIAAAVFAVVACSREPVAPEEPEAIDQSGSIAVTLVTDSPSTRTELGYVNSALKPYWSGGDAVTVVKVPTFTNGDGFETENYSYVFHHFNGNIGVDDDPAPTAIFSGSVSVGGQYRAIYPWRDMDYNWDLDYTYDAEDRQVPTIEFYIPSIQEPSLTSFDKRADLLVSAPFEVASGDHQLGDDNSEIAISFTRVNSIVKIKLNPVGTDLRRNLTGQKVRRVVLGEYSESSGAGGGELNAPRRRTRADYTDNNGRSHGLTGRVRYTFPYNSNVAGYDVNRDDEFFALGLSNSNVMPFAVAEYPNEAYDILTTNSEEATYLIVAPSILKNSVYSTYVNGVEETITEGLHVLVETDNYIIERNIVLGSNGIALQPSVVTTLNITIDENNSDTIVHEKEMSFEEPEQVFFPSDVSNKYGFSELVLTSSDMTFETDVFDASNWSFSVDGKAALYINPNFAYLGSKWDEEKQEYVNYVAGIIVVGQTVGETTLTVSYKGTEASCNISVIGLDHPFAQPISFRDWYVGYICVEQWGGNIVEDELTYYEASKVKWLTQNDQQYGASVFRYHNYHSDIDTFDELKYFTGLKQIGEYDFMNCSSLRSITLPDSVTGIGEEAFRGCSSLESIKLSDNLKWIGWGAFRECYELHQIVFPASLETIESNAFSGVSFYSGPSNGVEYKGIKFLGSTPPETRCVLNGYQANYGALTAGVDIYVPAGSKAAYEAVPNIMNSNYGPNHIIEYYFEDDYGSDNAAGNPFIVIDGGSF